MRMRNIQPGEILVISEGEYSDYGVLGLFTVIKEIDPVKVRSEFEVQHVREAFELDYQRNRKFVGYLNREGFIEDIQHIELHMNEYDHRKMDLLKNGRWSDNNDL